MESLTPMSELRVTMADIAKAAGVHVTPSHPAVTDVDYYWHRHHWHHRHWEHHHWRYWD